MIKDGRNIATGGKNIYGATVGILMLEARFPRIPGDMGNAATWPFPVHYHMVEGASPDLVVRRKAEGLLEPFLDGARKLASQGVDGITTNCGFLALFQDQLAQAVEIPVAASCLVQLPLIERLLPKGKRVGVITVSKATLTPDHLNAAGLALDTPIAGTEGGRELSRVILNDELELDIDKARADMRDAATDLLSAHDNIGAILLECTNMVPYARDLKQTFGLPVYSIYSFITWFQAGLEPRGFE